MEAGAHWLARRVVSTMTRLARWLSALVPPAVVLALSKVHAAWVADPPYDFTGSFRFGWAIGYGCLLVVTSYAVGLPDLPRSVRSAAASAAASVTIAAAGVSAVQLVVGDALLPRFVVFGSALALVPASSLVSLVARRADDGASRRERILFVGGRGEAQSLADDLDGPLERPGHLVATMTTDEARARPGAVPLLDAIESGRISLLVLDVAAQGDESIVAQAADAHAAGVRFRTLSLFYEEWLGKLPVSELERISLLFDVGEIHRARYARAKRVADLVAGAVGVLALVVLAPVVLVGNLVGNRGPLVFRQQRVGRSGVPFTIFKFRTMTPGGNGDWTRPDDPRITSFGRLLRRSHVDELPQAWNLLRGDLSLVGPRPEQPRYVTELTDKLPFYSVRHLVRPGITGWAQIKYGYASDERDALQKLQYEFFYLRRQGLSLDARIAVRTIRSLAGGDGR
jgi:lipopolysaccharide/colanic/teichoic acid biosynthesis glycosyltransferase